MNREIRNGWVNEMPKRIWARRLGWIARETIGREAFEQRRETGRNCGSVNRQHGTDISTDLRKLGSGHHVRRHSSIRARSSFNLTAPHFTLLALRFPWLGRTRSFSLRLRSDTNIHITSSLPNVNVSPHQLSCRILAPKYQICAKDRPRRATPTKHQVSNVGNTPR